MRYLAATCCALIVSVVASPAAAADASVSASVQPEVVEVNDNFRYVVTASVRGDEPIKIVKAPDFGPFKRVGQRRIPQLITINGVTTRRLSLAYTLRAPRKGQFTIHPPTMQVGKRRLKPSAVNVKVVAPGDVPAPKPRSRSKQGTFIDVEVEPDRQPWVGEQVTLSWDLFVDGARFDIRPTATRDPSLDEFWVETVPTRDQGRVVTYDGRLMRQIPLWRYAAFPLQSGPITLEPVEVELAIGTFTRRRAEKVRSEPLELDIKPLPPDAPPGFDEGNVGVYNFSVRARKNATKVGRAVAIEIEVSGDGHLARVELPDLPDVPRTRVSDVDVETTSRVRNGRAGGRKVKTVTLTALEEGTVRIPPLEFVYFDTRQEEYVVRESRPFTIRVAAGATPHQPDEPSELTRRDVSGGEDLVDSLMAKLEPPLAEPTLDAAPDPARFPWFYWFAGALGFLGMLGTAFWPRLETLRRKSEPERRRKQATRQVFELLEEAGKNPDAIYGALRDWLSDAFEIPRGAVTSDALARAFAERDLDGEAARRLAAVLKKCEQARFAPQGADTAALAREAREVATWVTKERGLASGVAATLVALTVVLVATATTAAPGLQNALKAQADEDWNAAADAWQAVVEENPAAVDAWYNLGTTAAHAERWAVARHAFERAAYLAPLDSEVGHNREVVSRIVRLEAIERSRTGRTMEGDEVLFWWNIAAHVHPHIAGVLLIVFWLLAAGLIVLRRRTESAAIRDAAFVGLVLSILLGVMSTVGAGARSHLLGDTEPVVLMAEELELREGPNDAAKLVRVPSTLVPGTLLRVTARRGEWIKIGWHDDAAWTRDNVVRGVRSAPLQ